MKGRWGRVLAAAGRRYHKGLLGLHLADTPLAQHKLGAGTCCLRRCQQ
jgi:hypothetical protein